MLRVLLGAESMDSGPRVVATRPSDRNLRLWVEACRDVSDSGHHRVKWLDLEKNPEELAHVVSAWASRYRGAMYDSVPLPFRAALLREIVGNPFRHMFREGRTLLLIVCPVCHGSARGKPCPGCNGYQRQLLTQYLHVWLTPTVLAMAQHAYDTRDFSGLPVLADALEEAGCDNADLLGHLRQDLSPVVAMHNGQPMRKRDGKYFPAMPHVRGCWALDLILGLE